MYYPTKLFADNTYPSRQPSVFYTREPDGLLKGVSHGSLVLHEVILKDFQFQKVSRWIYLSAEDPYCYEELIYDTAWFKSKAPEQHCQDLLLKKGCKLLTTTSFTSDFQFLEYKNTVFCQGIKGTRPQVRHGLRGWYPVYEYTKYGTIRGVLAFVQIGKRLVQIHPQYQQYALWFNGSQYVNAILNGDGTRAWLPQKYLTIGEHSSYASMVKNNIFYQSDGSHRLFNISIAYGNCNSPLHFKPQCDGAVCTHLYDLPQGTPSRVGFVQMTCGGLLCECADVPLDHLLADNRELIDVINDDLPWYGHLMTSVKDTFFSAVQATLRFVLGASWQRNIFLSIIIYLLTIRFVRSPLITIAISFAITQWFEMFLE